MKVFFRSMLLLVGTLAVGGPAEAKKCKDDAVKVGAVCVDKYEGSVWLIDPDDLGLIKKVQNGKIAAAADLVGATQHGGGGDDYGLSCPDTAKGCVDFYAVSIPGVMPAQVITWFQAAAFCRNAAKRLATNQEWTMAALGTPDPGTDNGTSDCNVDNASAILSTGSRSLCVSDMGAFDMIGNVNEWVADWGDRATNCTAWPAMYGNDFSCFGGDASVNLPGAFFRGGDYASGAGAGVFAVNAILPSDSTGDVLGFRCARDL